MTESRREVKAARGQFGECLEKERQAGRKGKVLCPINNPPIPSTTTSLLACCACTLGRTVRSGQAGRQAGLHGLGGHHCPPAARGMEPREGSRGGKGSAVERARYQATCGEGEDGSCSMCTVHAHALRGWGEDNLFFYLCLYSQYGSLTYRSCNPFHWLIPPRIPFANICIEVTDACPSRGCTFVMNLYLLSDYSWRKPGARVFVWTDYTMFYSVAC